MTPVQIEIVRAEIHLINDVHYQPSEDLLDLFSSKENLNVALSQYFISRLEQVEFKNALLNSFAEKDFVKARITEIANENLIRKTDLEKFYNVTILKSIKENINRASYTNNTLDFIKGSLNNDSKFNFLKTGIKKFINKQFDFIFTSGFLHNSTNINSGIMTANAGDSAQFLFLSRAILAGYNCSNVDVRSSRYDAVIDYNNYILRIQVKGISDGNSISFKDRDRGGQGIDHRHARNIGRRITSSDCDIYVAVDRQVGTCYLIPMSYADRLEDTSISLNTLEHYKENWSVIHETVALLKPIDIDEQL